MVPPTGRQNDPDLPESLRGLVEKDIVDIEPPPTLDGIPRIAGVSFFAFYKVGNTLRTKVERDGNIFTSVSVILSRVVYPSMYLGRVGVSTPECAMTG